MGRAGKFLRSGIGPIKGDSYLYSLVTRWWPGGPVGGTPKKSTNPSAPSKTSVFVFQHCFSYVLFFESQNHECKFLLSAVHMCLQTPTRASRAGIPPGGGGFRSGSLAWGSILFSPNGGPLRILANSRSPNRQGRLMPPVLGGVGNSAVLARWLGKLGRAR